MGINLDDYVDVPERIRLFREQYPDGTLQSEVLEWPHEFFPFVAVKAWAYRTPDDPRPGVGLAWENYPGKTPYTKDSELMNAETSAWGRALIAVGAADAKRIASRQEVQRVQGDRASRSAPEQPKASSGTPSLNVEGGVSEGKQAPTLPNPDRCDHEWKDAPRAGFELCPKCGTARRKSEHVA